MQSNRSYHAGAQVFLLPAQFEVAEKHGFLDLSNKLGFTEVYLLPLDVREPAVLKWTRPDGA